MKQKNKNILWYNKILSIPYHSNQFYSAIKLKNKVMFIFRNIDRIIYYLIIYCAYMKNNFLKSYVYLPIFKDTYLFQ